MADQQQPKQEQPKQLPGTASATKAAPTSPSSSAKTTDSTVAKPAKTGLLWLMTLVNLLLLAAFAYGGYWYFNQHSVTQNKLEALRSEVDQELNQKHAQMSSKTQALEQQLNAQAAATRDVVNGETEQLATISQLENQLQGALAQIQEMDGRRPTDWLIAEADYLVRMAGRKMWLEKDLRTAIMLLGNADQRLKSLADPSVLPVRALIAQDIQALQQVNPVAEVSVALALDGLIKQVDKLAIVTPKEATVIGADEVSDSASDWQQNLLNVWRSLVDDFIRVEYRDEPIEPMMTAQQEWISREQIKLALQQAQAAALASEQALYTASIERAQTIISDDYLQANSDVSGFQSALRELHNTDISKKIPTKLASQPALESLLDSRVKRVFGEGASAL
ncbi:uroporphyrinogen-III C-methyltransferase [Alteromonas lipolytica]|uniref:Heme biosynthesis operon protein HemX n=1 Tax=Alteromonas lipolytica TaxID=1856405 RepID=A0A1E8FHV3_9ALTE|nr:uroporphyrinogen-III C-methyltransferase [Alteromonas lipolytica]OFI35515.1 hypothetical protein BFC17_12175 [Alteromonas lipolytica]GGF76883.1 heme biosynthesis operon protein HemX [Alteromonas lipolytica]